MIRNGSIRMLTAAAAFFALSGAAVPARAGQVSDARIRELIKQAAAQAGGSQTTPSGTQTQTVSATGDTRPIVRLTLDEAVKSALERNLDITVQRLNPEINDIAYASIASVYHPSLTSTVGPQGTAVLPTSQTLLGTNGTPSTQTLTFNGGV